MDKALYQPRIGEQIPTGTLSMTAWQESIIDRENLCVCTWQHVCTVTHIQTSLHKHHPLVVRAQHYCKLSNAWQPVCATITQYPLKQEDLLDLGHLHCPNVAID